MWESFPLAEQREKAMAGSKEMRVVDKDSADIIKSTVSFKEVGKFTARRHFGAYLQPGEITVCGGETDKRKLLYSIEGISLTNSETKQKYMTLISGAAKFDLHVLNVPVAYFREDTAEEQPFQVGDTVTLTPTELTRLQNPNCFEEPLFFVDKYGRQIPIPYGTGTITAVGNEITVNFPSVQGWTGNSNQLQHATEE